MKALSTRIESVKAELHALHREYDVERLELFGSAATEAFDAATSKLDFIVAFADKSPCCADRYLVFAETLEVLFGRAVDLVTEHSISNSYFRQSIGAIRQIVCGRRREQPTAPVKQDV